VPPAVATAAPSEPSPAALSIQQPNAALPTQQLDTLAPSVDPVPSPVMQEAATPETPVAIAAAPTVDAAQVGSRTAPDSADSDPTSRSQSASSTSTNRRSTVVVRAAETPASSAQLRIGTEAAAEAMASTYSATAADALENG
jgi:hypothetical protein